MGHDPLSFFSFIKSVQASPAFFLISCTDFPRSPSQISAVSSGTSFLLPSPSVSISVSKTLITQSWQFFLPSFGAFSFFITWTALDRSVGVRFAILHFPTEWLDGNTTSRVSNWNNQRLFLSGSSTWRSSPQVFGGWWIMNPQWDSSSGSVLSRNIPMESSKVFVAIVLLVSLFMPLSRSPLHHNAIWGEKTCLKIINTEFWRNVTQHV